MANNGYLHPYQSLYEQDRHDYIIRHLQVSLASMSINETLIRQLNIVDSLLASGRLMKAKTILNDLAEPIKQSEDDDVIGYYLQLKATLLLHHDRVIESLEVWEEAVKIMPTLNARIGQAVALCRFYEPMGLACLETLLNEAEKHAYLYDYLRVQYRYYEWFLSINKVPFNFEIIPSHFHGLSVLFKMVDDLRSNNKSMNLNQLADELTITQGIQGGYFILQSFATNYPEFRAIDKVDNWYKRHVDPFNRVLQKERKNLFSNIDDEPKMAVMSCLNCDNRCCYDGVYVTYEEEKRIKEHMALYPEDFKDIPTDFLEDGEWEFLFGGKRTKRVPHNYTRSDFPAHFTHTICTFALPDGRCSLQQSAIKRNLHPWNLKPELCWEFPLIGLFNEDALNHPHYFNQKDPHYFDESQPGYLSFLPCSRVDDNGQSWKELYKNELQFYLHKKGYRP